MTTFSHILAREEGHEHFEPCIVKRGRPSSEVAMLFCLTHSLIEEEDGKNVRVEHLEKSREETFAAGSTK